MSTEDRIGGHATVALMTTEKATSATGLCFELRRAGTVPKPIAAGGKLPWHAGQAPQSETVLTIPAGDGMTMTWTHVADGKFDAVALQEDATLGFCVVRRGYSVSLGMVSRKEGVLVDGLPALRLTTLSRESSITVPGINALFYVTERFRPFVGSPSPEMLGQECPSCKIPVDADTRVVNCRCGLVYHYETEESHPALTESDRLACFQRTQVCLGCKKALTTEEHLIWNPDQL